MVIKIKIKMTGISRCVLLRSETNHAMIFYPDRKRPLSLIRHICIPIQEVWSHHIESSSCNFVCKLPLWYKAANISFQRSVQSNIIIAIGLLKLHSSLSITVSYINRKNTIVLKCDALKP